MACGAARWEGTRDNISTLLIEVQECIDRAFESIEEEICESSGRVFLAMGNVEIGKNARTFHCKERRVIFSTEHRKDQFFAVLRKALETLRNYPEPGFLGKMECTVRSEGGSAATHTIQFTSYLGHGTYDKYKSLLDDLEKKETKDEKKSS